MHSWCYNKLITQYKDKFKISPSKYSNTSGPPKQTVSTCGIHGVKEERRSAANENVNEPQQMMMISELTNGV